MSPRLEVEIDGRKEIVEMPADFARRRFDIYWNYELPEGDHTMKIRWLNRWNTPTSSWTGYWSMRVNSRGKL